MSRRRRSLEDPRSPWNAVACGGSCSRSPASLLLPYSAVLSVLGIVQGARARKKAKSRGTQAPGSLASIIVGIVGILWALVISAALAVFSDELRA